MRKGFPPYQTKLVSLLSQIYEGIAFVQNSNCVNTPCKQISLSKTRIFLDIIKERHDVIIIFHFFGSPFITPLLLLSKILGINCQEYTNLLLKHSKIFCDIFCFHHNCSLLTRQYALQNTKEILC